SRKWPTSLRRWDSPPERVLRGCPNRRYPSPTSSSTLSGSDRVLSSPICAKNSIDSLTVSLSRSWIDFPCSRTFRTCGCNRLPSHSAQRTKRSLKNCISIFSYPVPEQRSQRPLPELNENVPAVSPCDIASG